ncbi:MAG: type II toxin-antitoxin system RelB/DinJ family antitoxin [Oscillospiraceae bacterium]|nr:type II toxin-antitoxin system RelB/DinJ family antitoxin [Oscillospiraceae bacterium]
MKAITVRVDESIKEEADKMLEDIGLNMTTFITSSLKALVREKKVPFALVTKDYLSDQIILKKLAEAEKEAADPNTQWLSHDEVFGKLLDERLSNALLNIPKVKLEADEKGNAVIDKEQHPELFDWAVNG